jgi:splicing factor 3B subunit 5
MNKWWVGGEDGKCRTPIKDPCRTKKSVRLPPLDEAGSTSTLIDIRLQLLSVTTHTLTPWLVLHIPRLTCSWRDTNIQQADKLRTQQELERLQAKFIGTGHPDTTSWEWKTNIYRDTYSSIAGHPPHAAFIALATNEPVAKVKAEMIRVRCFYLPTLLFLWRYLTCCCFLENDPTMRAAASPRRRRADTIPAERRAQPRWRSIGLHFRGDSAEEKCS